MLRRTVLFAGATSLASLRNLVIRVVGYCSEEQMVRIYTRTHIAGVAYEQTIRDRSTMDLPRIPMSKRVIGLSGRAIVIEATVSVHAKRPHPEPAPAFRNGHDVRFKPAM